MDMPKEFTNMIISDIEKLNNIDKMTSDERASLHQVIDGRYQSCIKDWYIGLQGFTGQLIGPWFLKKYPDECYSNLVMMKSKLESYQFGMNAVQLPESSSTNVTVNNSITVNVTFEQVRQQVEDMTSLTDEQTQEVLDKIAEIEKVVTSNDKKKTKWEKIKPVLVWLADKSCDVGTVLLPLLLQI